MPNRKQRKRRTKKGFPKQVKLGSCFATIYYSPLFKSLGKKKKRRYDSFVVDYSFRGQQVRKRCRRYDLALAEADEAVRRIDQGEAKVLELTSEDRHHYLQARKVLDPLGVSLESAARQFAEAAPKSCGMRNLEPH